MDWTDRHDRHFLRLASRHAHLYTEMITTGALIYGDRARFLKFDPSEHPVALQLGGNDPDALARCAEFGEKAGYDEINLNCGCPSDRVLHASFGACLMGDPARVAAGVSAMRAAVSIPVTVKCRIGVDDSEDYVFLKRFIETVAAAGCSVFVVHARKAWLSGLSPKENREIPPLNYDVVYRIKREFPALRIVINGGITTLAACQQHLKHVDGVMLGREAYENPWLLSEVDPLFFGQAAPVASREQMLRNFIPYVARELAEGTRLNQITRHVLGLYKNRSGGRAFRRVLSERAHRAGAGLEVIEAALAAVESATALSAVA